MSKELRDISVDIACAILSGPMGSGFDAYEIAKESVEIATHITELAVEEDNGVEED